LTRPGCQWKKPGVTCPMPLFLHVRRGGTVEAQPKRASGRNEIALFASPVTSARLLTISHLVNDSGKNLSDPLKRVQGTAFGSESNGSILFVAKDACTFRYTCLYSLQYCCPVPILPQEAAGNMGFSLPSHALPTFKNI
jgi:hypothetical protein